MNAYIYIENGMFFEAKSFGADIDYSVAEMIFNTSQTGYQEIISDPSYAGQFIVFTNPEIGNVGVNEEDYESNGVYCKGIILRNYQDNYSNFRAKDSLANFLKKHNIIGISNIDTRVLTKLIRNEGAMNAIISSKRRTKEELKELLNSTKKISELNLVKDLSTKNIYKHNSGIYDMDKFKYKKAQKGSLNLAVIDFGVKKNILNELNEVGFNVEVFPYNTKADFLIKKYQNKEIDGVFLSNGPGDPSNLKEEIKEIKKLIKAKIPISAICLGHQLLSIAHNYDIIKLKFGQHGANHPVKNLKTNSIEITSQNHIYNVKDEIKEIANITHINLFDNTIEGLEYKNSKIISVQHHPEASPGPKESAYIFKRFKELITE